MSDQDPIGDPEAPAGDRMDRGSSVDSTLTRGPAGRPETRPETESFGAGSDTSIPIRTPAASDLPGEATVLRDRSTEAFPGYDLIEPLGEGGMGVVWKARQVRLNRMVAFKMVLGEHRVGAKELIRFLAEAEAVAAVRHPHVVQVHEYGEAQGRPFLVMEYLPGGSLTDRLKRDGRLDPKAAARLIRTLAGAVQAAHDQGIVHRDLKPGNVLFDESGQPKVTDFGLAKRSGKASDLTATRAVMGTPAYMAPEQARGDTKFVGPEADIYSLGVILYECLAGSRPFEDADPIALLRKVTEDEPERPGKRVAGLPRDAELICLKCLRKDSARRYPTASALAEDLRRYLDDEPIEARRISQVERLGRLARRHKMVAGLLAALLCVLSVGFVLTTVLWKRAEHNAVFALAKERAANAMAENEAKARAEAQAQEKVALERAEALAQQDYINRVNRAYREVQDDNVALAEDLLHGCPPGRRGWEWYYVEHLGNAERLALDLGRASVNALAFGPDGSWLVSGSGSAISGTLDTEPVVAVRDAATGEQRTTLPGPRGKVYSVSVSPDGQRVAAGCNEGLVLAWDVAAGQLAWSRNGPPMNVMDVAFSPDGRSLAVGYGYFSGGAIGRVEILDAASGEEVKSFSGPRGGVSKLAFHPGGRRIAAAGSGVVEVWDLDAATKVRDLKGHAKWIYTVAFSPDGKTLATGGWDRTVKLWDVDSGQEKANLFAHEGFVLDLAFSPDGRRLATVSEDRSLKLWEVADGRLAASFHGHTDFVQAVAFRPGTREIATGSLDGTVRVWDLRSSRPVVFEHSGWVENLSVRKDGMRVLSTPGRLRLATDFPKVWNPLTGEVDVTPLGDSPASGFVAGAGFTQTSATSPVAGLIARRDATAGAGEASRSKEYGSSAVILSDSTTGQVVHTLTGHSADVVCMTFSPDGRRLATASYDRTIKLWDTATGQDVFTLRGHTAGVVSLAFSPDGNLLISGGIDNTARVWNATPLTAKAAAEHDARYQRKVTMLARLKATTDDARRAEILAKGGQWGLAAAAFAKAVEREPKKLPLRYRYVLALAESGNAPALKAASRDLLETFGGTADPSEAAIVTAFCRLAPDSLADPRKLKAIRALAGDGDDSDRALALGRAGQWDLAAMILGRLVEGSPDNASLHNVHLLSLLEAGDVPGSRREADYFASKFAGTAAPVLLNNAAWSCALVPDGLADPQVPIRMAEAALAGYPADQKPMALNTLGAALYRAGRFDEAIRRLDESVQTNQGVGLPQDWVFLAMAHQRKGNREEALRWLEKLRPQIPREPSDVTWDNAEIHILGREAEALLRDQPPARP